MDKSSNLPASVEITEESRFYDYAKELLTTPKDPVEAAAGLLQTAYLDEGCMDEIKLEAFEEFAKTYLNSEGKQALLEARGTNKTSFVLIYLRKTYKLLRGRFDKKFQQRTVTGTPVDDVSSGVRGKVGKGFPDLHLVTEKLGYAQVGDTREALGSRGTHAWPVRNEPPKHMKRRAWRRARGE